MEFLAAHAWLLAPAIFLARVVDVSLGTFRTIIVFRGYRLLATAIGFVEVMIWVTAAGQVFSNLDSWNLTVAYAGGFACGNYVGMWLESHIAIGRELVRAISFSEKGLLAQRLRDQGYRVVELSGNADHQPVEVVLVIERRREVGALIATIRREDPQAIYTVSDVKSAYNPEPLSSEKSLFNTGWRVTEKRK
jgi:uncharacterized protein YebE (UPF0316 family)